MKSASVLVIGKFYLADRYGGGVLGIYIYMGLLDAYYSQKALTFLLTSGFGMRGWVHEIIEMLLDG